MNDTEEGMRRLFGAAAEDVPPGIDLLRGVRARRAAHRTGGRAVLSVGVAALLAAAGAITLSAVRAPSALAQLTAAATRTAAQSYRVTSTTAPVNAPPSGAQQNRVTGDFDPAHGVGEETFRPGPQVVRYVGGYIYVSAHKGGANLVPAGKSWLKVPARQDEGSPLLNLGTYGLAFDQNSPQNLLAAIESASQVGEVGSTSGAGWTGVRYTFTGTKRLGQFQHGVISAHGTVDVDQQGRVRRLNAVVSMTLYPGAQGTPSHSATNKVDTTFTDFGAPVSVTAPPASETFTPPGV